MVTVATHTTAKVYAPHILAIGVLITTTPGLTGDDIADIVDFVDNDAQCDGHPLPDDAYSRHAIHCASDCARQQAYCDGSCVPYDGPAPELVRELIKTGSLLFEDAADLVRAAYYLMGR